MKIVLPQNKKRLLYRLFIFLLLLTIIQSASADCITGGPTVDANTDGNVIICPNGSTSAWQLNGHVGGSATGGVWSSSTGKGQFIPNATTVNALFIPDASDVM